LTRLAAAAVLAIGLWAVPPATAQVPAAAAPAAPASAAPPVVDDVRAEREGRPVIDPSITSLIATAAHQPLSMREVRETIAHLVNLNQFEDVQVLSEPAAPGHVRLLYRLMPAHPVDRIEFRGMTGLSEGELRKTVNERFGDPSRAAQVPGVSAALRSLYRDRGYPEATVNGELV
jgi:outer membrane protein assembly factor BamA